MEEEERGYPHGPLGHTARVIHYNHTYQLGMYMKKVLVCAVSMGSKQWYDVAGRWADSEGKDSVLGSQRGWMPAQQV